MCYGAEKTGTGIMSRRFLWIIFGFLLSLTSCATNSTIVNSVPEREANEIVVLLNSKGIAAVKTSAPTTALGGGTGEKLWDISVPPNQITESLSILNQTGLPRIKGTSLLDLFGSQGLVPSDMQDKIRYQEGLSEQLATTIRKMDGIMDANVQITFPSEEETGKPLTASVYVKHRGILDNPNSLAITKIKRLVSSAVPNLSVENVQVITDRALYADLSLQTPQQLEEDKHYVAIWSIAVAKESAARFRFIFYAFIIILFLLACALAWLIWKFFPLIHRKGGLGFLAKPDQYESDHIIEVEEKGRKE